TAFAKERLLKDIDAIVRVTTEPLAKEAKAVAARKEGAGGFGPPGAFGPPAPDLKAFVEKRAESVAAQLAGKSKGYGAQVASRPPGGGRPGGRGAQQQPPVTDKTIRDVVSAPDGFDVTLFGAPPDVNYPVTVAAAPTGEVFIAVDEQGSLGRTPGGGK